MKTDAGLDTGDMLLRRELPVLPEDTAGSLSEKLSALGGECIAEALRALQAGRASFEKQDGSLSTLCKKIRKEDCAVDFSESAATVCRLIRAMAPAPLAYAYLNGKLVNFYFAEPAEGCGRAGEVVRADRRAYTSPPQTGRSG